ncbi:NOL1/NOP2/sun family protein [Toxoplasma gondii GAB2-2007-GAL-DOM2]|nr:NOL1/NOP2/sun family protein [Toxoplasma gondii p89]KFG32040.1 NOL1/NOP2/sun family protein [Toxoplasma gondii GAB2-2007-GAL-DOM2]KFH03331.1 NOL1/NOP2/sun family protein [Toxoplasma gondii VAND]
MVRYMRRRILFLNLDFASSLLLSDSRIVDREELLRGEQEGQVTALDSCRDESGALEAGGCVCVVCPTEVLPSSKFPSPRPTFSSLADAVCLSCLLTPGGNLHCYVSRTEAAGLAFHLFGIDEEIKDEVNEEE